MTEFAKRCIVCKIDLRNVDGTSTNQPYEGTTFTSRGHYGSTAFDPMDGSYLEFNICDECLRKRAGEGYVMFGRDRVPVCVSSIGPLDNVLVGWRRVHRELVDWNGEQDIRDDITLWIDSEDVGSDLWDRGEYRIEWLAAAVESIKREMGS